MKEIVYHHFHNFHSFRRTEICTGEYWIIFMAMEDIQSGAKVSWRGLYVVKR